MVPNIQEEYKVKPEEEAKMKEEEEEIVKSTLEELKSLFEFGAIIAILLNDIATTILEESKVRLTEEMVRFRKSMAAQMLNSSDHKMNDEVNLLKMDRSFRAAWSKWMETPNDQKAEEAYKVFESCLFKTNDEQVEAER